MEAVLAFLGEYGIAIVPVLLLGGAFGAPFPEDLVVLGSGYLAYQGTFNTWVSVPVLVFSVYVADLVMYVLGSKVGEKLIDPEKKQKVAEWLDRKGIWIVCAARVLPGARGATYLSCGALGYSFRRFAFADAFAVSLFVPSLFAVGYLSGPKIEAVLQALQTGGQTLGVGIGVFVAGALGFWVYKNKKGNPS